MAADEGELPAPRAGDIGGSARFRVDVPAPHVGLANIGLLVLVLACLGATLAVLWVHDAAVAAAVFGLLAVQCVVPAIAWRGIVHPEWVSGVSSARVTWLAWAVAGVVLLLANAWYWREHPLDVGVAAYLYSESLAGVASIAVVAALVWTVIWQPRDRSTDPFLERGVWLAVGKTVAGVLGIFFALMLVFGAFVQHRVEIHAEVLNERLAAPAVWSTLEPLWLSVVILILVVPFGWLATGFLQVAHQKARFRRVARAQLLDDRVQDHFATGRVSQGTYDALRKALVVEINGLVPGERRVIGGRAAVARLALAAVLFVLLGAAAALEAADIARDATLPETAVAEGNAQFAPCYGCRTEAEYQTYRELYQLWADSSQILPWPFLLFGAYLATLVPLQLHANRLARKEAELFWENRRSLEQEMLEEVRAASV